MESSFDTRGQRIPKSLLIICLFVANAAGDCSQPEESSTVILSDEALLRNDFPDGSEVTLLCTTGYFKKDGSGIIKCINQDWTTPDLVCQKKDCGPPQSKPYMHFDTSQGTLFGSITLTTCDKGYKIQGMSYRECLDGGWFGRGSCQNVTCRKPPNVANGRSLWVHERVPIYAETVGYSCDEGYTLIGDSSIKCNEHGVYDSQPPECKKTSTSAVVSTTPTAPHRDNTITVTASATVPPSEQGGTFISTLQGKAVTTSATTSSSSFGEMQDEAIDTNKDLGHIAVIISVIVVTLVASICIFFLNKFLLRRKGSYDTGEDLKPELLQFQTL